MTDLSEILNEFVDSTGRIVQQEFLVTFPSEQLNLLRFLQSIISSYNDYDSFETIKLITQDITLREYLTKLNHCYYNDLEIKESTFLISKLKQSDQLLFMNILKILKMVKKLVDYVVLNPIVTPSSISGDLHPKINSNTLQEQRKYLNQLFVCFENDVSHFPLIKILQSFHETITTFLTVGPKTSEGIQSTLRNLAKDVKENSELKVSPVILKQIDLLNQATVIADIESIIVAVNAYFAKQCVNHAIYDDLVRKYLTLEVLLGASLPSNHMVMICLRCAQLAKDICWAITRSSTEECKVLIAKLSSDYVNAITLKYYPDLNVWIESLPRNPSTDVASSVTYDGLKKLFDHEKNIEKYSSFQLSSALALNKKTLDKPHDNKVDTVTKTWELQCIKTWLYDYQSTTMSWASFYTGSKRKLSSDQVECLESHQSLIVQLINECNGPISSMSVQHLIDINRSDPNTPLALSAYNLFQRTIFFLIRSIGERGYLVSLESLPSSDLYPIYNRLISKAFSTLNAIIFNLPVSGEAAKILHESYIRIIRNTLELSYPEVSPTSDRFTPNFITTAASNVTSAKVQTDINFSMVYSQYQSVVELLEKLHPSLIAMKDAWNDARMVLNYSDLVNVNAINDSPFSSVKQSLICYSLAFEQLMNAYFENDYLQGLRTIENWIAVNTFDDVKPLIMSFRALFTTIMPYQRTERNMLDLLYQPKEPYNLSIVIPSLFEWNRYYQYDLGIDKNILLQIQTRDEEVTDLYQDYQKLFYKLQLLYPSKTHLQNMMSSFISASSTSKSVNSSDTLLSFLFSPSKGQKLKEFEPFARKHLSNCRSVLIKATDYINQLYNLDIALRSILKALNRVDFQLPSDCRDMTQYVRQGVVLVHPINSVLSSTEKLQSYFIGLSRNQSSKATIDNRHSRDMSTNSLSSLESNDSTVEKPNEAETSHYRQSSLATSFNAQISVTTESESSNTPNNRVTLTFREDRLFPTEFSDQLKQIAFEIHPLHQSSEEYHLLPSNACQSKKDLLEYIKQIDDIHSEMHSLGKSLQTNHQNVKLSKIVNAVPINIRPYLHAYNIMAYNYLINYLESSITKSSAIFRSAGALPAITSSSIHFTSALTNKELKLFLTQIFNQLPFIKSKSLLSLYYSFDLLFESRLIHMTKAYSYFDLVILHQTHYFQKVTPKSDSKVPSKPTSPLSGSSFSPLGYSMEIPRASTVIKTSDGIIVTKETYDVEIMSKFSTILQELVKEEIMTLPSKCSVPGKDHSYQRTTCVYCKNMDDILESFKIFGSRSETVFPTILYDSTSIASPSSPTASNTTTTSIESPDPCNQLQEFLSLFQMPCDVAGLTYFTHQMKMKNGLALLQDMTAASAPHHRMLVAYVYSSIFRCFSQVLERFCFKQLTNRRIRYHYFNKSLSTIETTIPLQRRFSKFSIDSKDNLDSLFIDDNQDDQDMSIDQDEFSPVKQLEQETVDYSPKSTINKLNPSISIDKTNEIVVNRLDRFPYPNIYQSTFSNGITLSSRNRYLSTKLTHEKYGYRLHVNHPVLFAVDIRPDSLKYSKSSTFHSFSKLNGWKWFDEEVYNDINQSLDLSLCHNRVDITLYFVQSYLNISNLYDKLRVMNKLEEVQPDLLKVMKWTLNVRQMIFTESWQELEELLLHYKRNESYYYSHSREYVSWMDQGPIRLCRLANAILNHHHSIHILDQHINVTNANDRKSNGLFFKFIDFDLLGDALKSALRCSIQSDELRQKIAIAKFVYDLNISTVNGYWVDDHIHDSSMPPLSVSSTIASPVMSPNTSPRSANSQTRKGSVSYADITNRSFSSAANDPLIKITPSVATLLKIVNEFTLIGLTEDDEKNIPISLSIFPTLIQSEIQNVEREFQNQQIEDRLIQSIQVGKEYLNDVTNLAASIDIQSLEKIVEAASTLRQRSQRNIALYDIAMKIFRLRQSVKQGNWIAIRGLLNEIDSNNIVPEVADEIYKLKQLAQSNQRLHDDLVHAMTSNQIRGSQIKLDVSNTDIVHLLRGLSSARHRTAPILSPHDRIMVHSAEILTTIRTCVLMEDYDRLRSEINAIKFNTLSSHCIQEILLVKSSIDLWMNLKSIHDCLRSGGVSGDVGALQVRCPSLYRLTTSLMSMSSIQYPEATKLFLDNAKIMEHLRQAVKCGKWNISQISFNLCSQLKLINSLQDQYKTKIMKLNAESLMTSPTNVKLSSNEFKSSGQSISIPSTHDNRYFLSRIEDVNYCQELFGGQLFEKSISPSSNANDSLNSQEMMKNRRYLKEVEYLLKKLLTNVSVSMRTKDNSDVDVDYWSLFRTPYTDVPGKSIFISKLLVPQDITVSHKSGKLIINTHRRPSAHKYHSYHASSSRFDHETQSQSSQYPYHDNESDYDAVTTAWNDHIPLGDRQSFINRQGVAEILLSSANLLADVENEVALIRDELYHRISMFVLQQGLLYGRIMINDDKLVYSLTSVEEPRKSTTNRTAYTPKQLKKSELIKSSSATVSYSKPFTENNNHLDNSQYSSTLTQVANILDSNDPLFSSAVSPNTETINLESSLAIVEHLGIKSTAVFKRYRTSLLINKLRQAIRIKNNHHLIDILKEVRILKDSDCFDSLAIVESRSTDSLVKLKYNLLKILREYHHQSSTLSMKSKSEFGYQNPSNSIVWTSQSMKVMNQRDNEDDMLSLSSILTIHSRKLFELCELCVDFVDALGRQALTRIYHNRNRLQKLWVDLDLSYYQDELRDGFQYIRDFMDQILERYPTKDLNDKETFNDPSSLSLTWNKTAVEPTIVPIKVIHRSESTRLTSITSNEEATSHHDDKRAPIEKFDFQGTFSHFISFIERVLSEALSEYVSADTIHSLRDLIGRVLDSCLDAVSLWDKSWSINVHDIITFQIIVCVILEKILDNKYIVPMTANVPNSDLPVMTSPFSKTKTKMIEGSSVVIVGYGLTNISTSLLEATLTLIRLLEQSFQRGNSRKSFTTDPSESSSEEKSSSILNNNESPKRIMRMRKPVQFTIRTMNESIMPSIQSGIHINTVDYEMTRTMKLKLRQSIESIPPADPNLLVTTGDYVHQMATYLLLNQSDMLKDISLRLRQLMRQQVLLQKSALLQHTIKFLS